MTFTKGKYKTKGGHKAQVIRVRSIQGKWRLEGYIECPDTHALVLHDWHPDGTSIAVDTHPGADVFSLDKKRR
jgi:hypothetical protein